MKICKDCGIEKPLEEYPTRGKSGRLRTWCRSCANARGRKNYHKNRAANAAKINTNRQIRKAEISHSIRVLKESTACLDCGKHYAWYQMDFDHVIGKKVSDISKMVKDGAAKDRIWSEITKCELVCANCHRQRTFKHMGVAIYEEIDYEEIENYER